MQKEDSTSHKGLTLSSHVISIHGAEGANIADVPVRIPPYSVGVITMIHRQMTGDITVKITYQDWVSEVRNLDDVLDLNQFVTNVSMPNSQVLAKTAQRLQATQVGAVFCRAMAFATRHFCPTAEIIPCDAVDTHKLVVPVGNEFICTAIGILVFVEYDMDADTPTLSSRGFDKLPTELQKGSCVTPWLDGSQPGIGPDSSFGYWMGYTVDMRKARLLF